MCILILKNPWYSAKVGNLWHECQPWHAERLSMARHVIQRSKEKVKQQEYGEYKSQIVKHFYFFLQRIINATNATECKTFRIPSAVWNPFGFRSSHFVWVNTWPISLLTNLILTTTSFPSFPGRLPSRPPLATASYRSLLERQVPVAGLHMPYLGALHYHFRSYRYYLVATCLPLLATTNKCRNTSASTVPASRTTNCETHKYRQHHWKLRCVRVSVSIIYVHIYVQ